MANVKNEKKDALAIINAALTILERYPEFDNTDTTLSFDTSTNPFTFLMDLFKSTAGYDMFIRIISGFIVFELPALELAIKGILLSNLKNILSCSLNPFISNEVLMNGIVLDLKDLDVMNMLSYCPLDKKGKYLYFGCDYFINTDELAKAGDFNAFLWYVKNKPARRRVWYGVNFIKSNIDSMFYEDEDLKVNVIQKEPESEVPSKGDEKCKKEHGIITLKYCERPTSLRRADGSGGLYIQTPHYNCLQVFIGNTQDTNPTTASGDSINSLEEDIIRIDYQISDIEKEIEEIEEYIEQIGFEFDYLELQWEEQTIDHDTYVSEYERLTANQNGAYETIKNKRAQIDGDEENEGLIQVKAKKMTDLNGLISNLDTVDQDKYRGIEQNYYYKHTLIEFNTDYIMSLKLFDAKTLVAQLIDALTGCITVDLNLSYEQMIVKYETQKMVKAIIESDDVVVSDCFFTFSNAEYDSMLKKAELAREGLYAMEVDNPTGVKVDAESILNSLNEIDSGASQETIQSVIEGSLNEISKTLSNTEYVEEDKVNAGAEINFIENIMNNLAYVITMSILSPKVYLAMAINLQLLGRQTGFNINDFIEANRQMIAQILREVRDRLVQYMVDKLMEIVKDLASNVALKMAAEQAEYYMHLIKRLIECFKSNRGTIGFDIDDVDYADIYPQEEEPKNNEC